MGLFVGLVFFGGCVFCLLFDALRAGYMLSNKVKELIFILGAKKHLKMSEL